MSLMNPSIENSFALKSTATVSTGTILSDSGRYYSPAYIVITCSPLPQNNGNFSYPFFMVISNGSPG